MFKNTILGLVSAVAGLGVVGETQADQFVRGHYQSNGYYVQPHFRSSPDHSVYNNYSTFPNVNPYTGRIGTHHYPAYSYPTYGYQNYGYSYPSYNYDYGYSYTYRYGW